MGVIWNAQKDHDAKVRLRNGGTEVFKVDKLTATTDSEIQAEKASLECQGTAQDGLGLFKSFEIENDAGEIEEVARLEVIASDVSNGSEDAKFVFKVKIAGTLTEVGTLGAGVGSKPAIADPGDAGAIPVTVSGYCPLVSAGAETRTLAAPAFIGQEIVLYFKTDGGDITLTCATTINETGNNTIVFANTGDSFKATAVEEGSTLRWRLAVADGAALSTV